MCGRICLNIDIDSLKHEFSLVNNVILKPRYNIAPGQVTPVLRKLNALEFMTWGFRPSWLKPDQNTFINARAETLLEKPAFKQAIKNRRCLIVATGYYEWKLIGTSKQPYYIFHSEHKTLALAGIWDGDGCAIITKPAQQDLLAIHERMPLIIKPEHYALWLNQKYDPDLLSIVQKENITLSAYPVSTKVNSPKHDSSECILALQ
jgi:putative SOS response-associated peptidase YedK